MLSASIPYSDAKICNTIERSRDFKDLGFDTLKSSLF